MGVFPISSKHVICWDCYGTALDASLIFPMCGQKRLEIGFGNPHHAVEAMRYETLLLDPAPDCALAHPDAFSDLFDSEELRWCF